MDHTDQGSKRHPLHQRVLTTQSLNHWTRPPRKSRKMYYLKAVYRKSIMILLGCTIYWVTRSNEVLSINTHWLSTFNQSYGQGYGKKSSTVSFFTPVLFSFLSSPLHLQKILSYLLEQWLQALNSKCLSFSSFNLYNWVVCSCFSMSLVGPGKANSNKTPTRVPSTLDNVK